MRAEVVDQLGRGARPFGSVHAILHGFSEVIEVRVTAPTPSGAADAANAYAEVFVAERQRELVDAIETQSAELRRRVKDASAKVAEIDRQLATPGLDPAVAENLRATRTGLTNQVLSFGNRADELDVEAALRRGTTEIVTRAGLELSPISPKPLRAGVTALVLGLLAGVAVAVVLEIFQDKLSDPEELTALDPSIPLLGSIPHFPTEDGELSALTLAAREAFKYIRTSLKFRSPEHPVHSVVVTSAMSGEGKTTTALHLAIAVSETGSRVMLVDADLRRPAIKSRLGLPGEVGLSEVLAGEVTLADAVHYVTPTLAVLTAGTPSSTASELLGGAAYSRLVAAASKQSDLLIVDVPPVLPVADPLVAARSVDGAIVVARIGHVRRRELRALLRRLQDARLPVLGFVANDSDSRSGYGEYATAYIGEDA